MCAGVEKQQQKMDVLRLYKCLRSSDPFYVSYYIKWVLLLLGHIIVTQNT